jgi:hypothetical protein
MEGHDHLVADSHVANGSAGHVVSVAGSWKPGLAYLGLGLDGASVRLEGMIAFIRGVKAVKIPTFDLLYGAKPKDRAYAQDEYLVARVPEENVTGFARFKMVRADGSEIAGVAPGKLEPGKYLWRESEPIPLDRARMASPEREAYAREYGERLSRAELTRARAFEISPEQAARLGGR